MSPYQNLRYWLGCCLMGCTTIEAAPQPHETAAPGPPIQEPPALERGANVRDEAANPEPDVSSVAPPLSPMPVLTELFTAQGLIVALLLTPFSQESTEDSGGLATQQ